MKGLARLFDFAVGVNVVDMATGAQTGNRVHLRNYETLTVLWAKRAGTAAQPVTLTLQEHNAETGGTSQNLPIINEYYLKDAAAALANTEQWTRVTQAAAATVVPAASDRYQLLAFEVEAGSLSDTFQWVSVNTSAPAAAQLGTVLYVLHGLRIQRAAEMLAAPRT